MNTDEIRLVIEALLIPMAGLCVHILSDLKKSVQELNIKVAVVIARLDGHESRIGKLEEK